MPIKQNVFYKPALLSTLIFGALQLTGCSGAPPNEQLTRSSYAIKAAEESGARDLAPLELRNANKTLEKAQAAVQDEDYDDALSFAKTAEVEAELAKAKTEAASLEKSSTDIKQGVQTLRQELQRSNLNK